MIEEAESRRAAIAGAYAEPGFFERTSADELAALDAEDKALATRIDEGLAEWETLEAELAKGEA